jgi:hypothetical protein
LVEKRTGFLGAEVAAGDAGVVGSVDGAAAGGVLRVSGRHITETRARPLSIQEAERHPSGCRT